MSQIRKLAGQTAIYGLSSVLGRLLNYLLVPLYTAVFDPAAYGVVTEFYAYVAFFNIIYMMGMETAYFRFSSDNPIRDKQYYENAVTLLLIFSILLSGILSLFATPVVNWLEYPGYEKYIYWLSAIMAIDAVVSVPFARLRLQNKAWKFAIIKLVNITVNIGFNLVFLLIVPAINPSWDVVVDYVFLSNLIANALLLVLLFKELTFARLRVDKEQAVKMLQYSSPLIIIGLAGVTNEMLSRAMLKHWLPDNFYPNQTNLEALGVFGACYKLSVFMTLGIQAFRYAAEPFFFKQAGSDKSPQLFSEVTDKFIQFGAWVFVAISINVDLLGFLFLQDPAYWAGLHVVPFLLLGGLFLGVYYNLSIWYKLTDRTLMGAAIASTGAIITIIFNAILIPQLGYLGSAMVTLITYFSMTVISYLVGQKYFPVPYKVGKGLLHIAVAVIIVFAFQQLTFVSLLWSTSAALIVLVIYGALLYAIERKNLQSN